MPQILSVIVFFHVVGGSCALLFGLLPICTKKGSLIHRKTGIIYCWSMALIAVTSALIFLIKPFSDGRLFLFFIGVFSFYLAFSGVRVLRFANGKVLKGPVRRNRMSIANLITIVGLVMLSISVWQIFRFTFESGRQRFNYLVFAILYILFGWFSVGMGREDRRQETALQPPAKRDAYLVHIGRMLGAYTATVTAFCVVNGSQWFSSQTTVFIWVLPGAIGGGLISWFIGRFKKTAI